MKTLLIATAVACLPAIASADEIEDALNAAMEAYKSGDVGYAIEELDFARGKLNLLKTDEFAQFLPDAPEGWTREVNTEMSASLGLMGGGVGAEADYVNEATGEDYTITIMADNPMVTGMASIVANASLMGLQVERIGRQKFAVQDGQLVGLVANRFLIQVDGRDVETMKAALAQMDFGALAAWGL